MIDALLIAAIIWVESGDLGSAATSSAGAKGVMQIADATFNEWAGELHIVNPDIRNDCHNIAVGTAYISYLNRRYGDLRLALTAYNWGLGHLNRAMRTIQSIKYEDLVKVMPKEARDYAPKVLAKYEELKRVV